MLGGTTGAARHASAKSGGIQPPRAAAAGDGLGGSDTERAGARVTAARADGSIRTHDAATQVSPRMHPLPACSARHHAPSCLCFQVAPTMATMATETDASLDDQKPIRPKSGACTLL